MFNVSEDGDKIMPRVNTEGGVQQEQTRIIPTAAMPQGSHFEAKNGREASRSLEAGFEGYKQRSLRGKDNNNSF